MSIWELPSLPSLEPRTEDFGQEEQRAEQLRPKDPRWRHPAWPPAPWHGMYCFTSDLGQVVESWWPVSGLRQAGGFVSSSLGQRPKRARVMDEGRYSNDRQHTGKWTMSLNMQSFLPS